MTISVSAAEGASNGSTAGSIGIQDFLKILTAQLNSQDPLKPVDNQEFVAQIAQFANLEQSRQLNAKIDSLLAIESSTQSFGLLGKTVDVANNNSLVTGRVTALSLASGQPLMSVTTSSGAVLNSVALTQLINVR